MSSLEIVQKPPQDIGELNGARPLAYIAYSHYQKFNVLVAIFHASFHPTRGHVIDWSLRASDGAQDMRFT